MRRLLRTIRFDASDDRVFERAAGPGQWAVSGAFAFLHLAPGEATGKMRQAFANGFLGLDDFGRSTFATVGEIPEAEFEALRRHLAAHFVEVYGAPDIDAALPAADEELAFALDLCQGLAINTVLTVRRRHDEAGAIREEFRPIAPPTDEPMHARVWAIEADDA